MRLQLTYSILDTHIQPAIARAIEEGKVAVLLGASGTGKSTMAQKILPDAFLASGNKAYSAKHDLILNDTGITIDQALQMRNLAIGSGRAVLMTGQCWEDVSPLLEGLGVERFRLFNLNTPWGIGDEHMIRRVPDDVIFGA